MLIDFKIRILLAKHLFFDGNKGFTCTSVIKIKNGTRKFMEGFESLDFLFNRLTFH